MWICAAIGAALVPMALLSMCRFTSPTSVCALAPPVAVAARSVRSLSPPLPAIAIETCWMPISASLPAPAAVAEAVATAAPWPAWSRKLRFCIHIRLLPDVAFEWALTCVSGLPCRSIAMPPSLMVATLAPVTL